MSNLLLDITFEIPSWDEVYNIVEDKLVLFSTIEQQANLGIAYFTFSILRRTTAKDCAPYNSRAIDVVIECYQRRIAFRLSDYHYLIMMVFLFIVAPLIVFAGKLIIYAAWIVFAGGLLYFLSTFCRFLAYRTGNKAKRIKEDGDLLLEKLLQSQDLPIVPLC